MRDEEQQEHIESMLINLSEAWNGRYDEMTEWEQQFIEDMSTIVYDKGYNLTDKQLDKLEEIYKRYAE